MMAIRSFSVGARRGLVAAAADSLPNLVAIAGPNGSGKSALLEQLWQQRYVLLEPGTEALYVGPNRAWRAGPLSDLAARSFTQDYEQILKADSFPGFQYGIAPGNFHFLGGMSRFGSNADDAQAFVKTSIVRIANRAEAYIAKEFRRQGGQIAAGSVPELLTSFSSLIETLLPHLQFERVEASDPNNVQVLFSPKGDDRAGLLFDIDELSSGEKAAIALFLPFIERQIRAMTGDATLNGAAGVVPLTLLLDEPEIHLHPLLQLNVLQYMRTLARAGDAQFIFTTHSPSLLDAMDPEELYLLSPAQLAPDNQLSRLSLDVEKLEAARTITGATHLLTRGKPIVFVEGEPDHGGRASDKRLLGLLVEETEHWAIVPSHGNKQVVRAVRDMRESQLALPGLPVFGLVDGDQGQDTGNEHVVAWPVAMIENLLLDPQAIAQVLSPYGTLARAPEAIHQSLLRIAHTLSADEMRIRVEADLEGRFVQPRGEDADTIKQSIRTALASLEEKVDSLDLVEIVSRAREQVDGIVAAGLELERFRGKQILRQFFDEAGLAAAGLGWNAFLTELARHAGPSERARRLTQPAVNQIRLFFPRELQVELQALPESPERDDLLAIASAERGRWEQGQPQGDGREALRQRVFHLGRELRAVGDMAGDRLMHLAVSIGTLS